MERWRCATPPQPEPLANEVWHRICALESDERRQSWFARIELAFSRPAFAVAFLAACILLGLFLAEVRLTGVRARQTAEMEHNYLRLLDPLGEASATVQPTSHHP